MSASLQVRQFFQSYKLSASFFGHSGHLAVTVQGHLSHFFLQNTFKKTFLIIPIRVKLLAILEDPKTQKS